MQRLCNIWTPRTATPKALMKQRKWLEAIDQCHAALRFDPAHTKSSWRGAMCAIEVGMHDVAVAFVESGLDENMVSTELLELRRRLGPLPDVELHKGMEKYEDRTHGGALLIIIS
ncbi:unnamed protein product [Durusdinium trenchii]|uniref:Uncharacterized protein n=1 Tax=Durusdinium trenchii TaxID=1381693 RepID=A0ABP0Q2A6_9DINO